MTSDTPPADLYARDQRAVSHMSNLRFFPQAVIGGEGSWLIQDDGRRLLDLSASWGAASLGHGHPGYRAAINAALETQAGSSVLSTANGPATALAEKLLSLVPERAAGSVWLGHSGSDANETVARAVVAATGRKRIISFKGAYHGGAAGSMAISGHSAQEGAPKMEGLSLTPYPDPYRDGPDAGPKALAALQALFDGPCPPEEVAAFFIEPIQADGGVLVPPEGFFKEVEALCRKHGILLVCDEVKVGLARTGKMHCFEHLGIEPDIIVFGKGLGGGLPVSAAVGPKAIMNHSAAFSFQTLHGNPICASAGLAVLDAIQTEGLIAKAAETGAHLRRRLEALKEQQPLIGHLRGAGLVIGVELVSDRAAKTPAKRATQLTVYRAFELGLVVYYVGMSSNVLELTPPLTMTIEEADQAVDILAQALDDVAAGRVDESKLDDFAGW